MTMTDTVSAADFAAANRRAADQLAKGPVATSACFDQATGRITIALSSGLDISFKASQAQGLAGARASQLKRIEISPSGLGLHFPALDADLYLPALLEGFLGSRQWMASSMGKAGGRVTSEAKARAARANGRLGGRPSNKPTALDT